MWAIMTVSIIGLLAVLSSLIVFWLATRRSVLNCIRSTDAELRNWKTPLLFSLGYQTVFMLYGITGNPLYDQNCVIMYFLSCSICMAFIRFEKTRPSYNPDKRWKLEKGLDRIAAAIAKKTAVLKNKKG